MDEVDGVINSFSSSYMCSYLCPCDVTQMSEWYQLSDEKLNSYARTKYPPGVDANSDWRWDAY